MRRCHSSHRMIFSHYCSWAGVLGIWRNDGDWTRYLPDFEFDNSSRSQIEAVQMVRDDMLSLNRIIVSELERLDFQYILIRHILGLEMWAKFFWSPIDFPRLIRKQFMLRLGTSWLMATAVWYSFWRRSCCRLQSIGECWFIVFAMGGVDGLRVPSIARILIWLLNGLQMLNLKDFTNPRLMWELDWKSIVDIWLLNLELVCIWSMVNNLRGFFHHSRWTLEGDHLALSWCHGFWIIQLVWSWDMQWCVGRLKTSNFTYALIPFGFITDHSFIVMIPLFFFEIVFHCCRVQWLV